MSGWIVAALVVTACGGDDDGAASPVTVAAADQNDSAATDEGGVLADNDVRDVLDEAVGTDGEAGLDEAIATLSPGTRYGIVAGLLDPEPDVEINGTDIRLVFPGGSVTNSFADCIVVSVIQEVDEVVTVVYPDGEQAC